MRILPTAQAAAIASRAECVMLNKGPYLFEAIEELDQLLQRCEGEDVA